MSLYPYELVLYKPNKADPVSTRKKFEDGFVIQRQQPDFIGVALEGVKVEDESLALRLIEWTSYDGHMRFRDSPAYKEFQAVREGAYIAPSVVTHYTFLGPLPLKPMPPADEILDFTLKPDASFSTWAAEFGAALQKYLPKASGHMGIVIGQQMENPCKALALSGWESVEAHMVGFAKSEEYKAFQAELKPIAEKYFAGPREMWHIKTCEPGYGV